MLAMKAASVEAAFGKLGEGIERQWRTLDYDQDAFNAIAVEMLASAGIVGSIGSEDILDWAMTSRQLPAQHDLAATFGQPPLTMYRTERFHVSVLFWLSATVSIHEHGFEGAFGVLDGSSIHSSWTFEQTLSISTNLKLGTVRRNSTELLEIGAIRPILAGPSGAHSLVHLDTPSATVVIRTCADPRHHLQYNYLVPGVAINPEYPDQTLVKKCQLIKLIAVPLPRSTRCAHRRIVGRRRCSVRTRTALGGNHDRRVPPLVPERQRSGPGTRRERAVDPVRRRRTAPGKHVDVPAEPQSGSGPPAGACHHHEPPRRPYRHRALCPQGVRRPGCEDGVGNHRATGQGAVQGGRRSSNTNAAARCDIQVDRWLEPGPDPIVVRGQSKWHHHGPGTPDARGDSSALDLPSRPDPGRSAHFTSALRRADIVGVRPLTRCWLRPPAPQSDPAATAMVTLQMSIGLPSCRSRCTFEAKPPAPHYGVVRQ